MAFSLCSCIKEKNTRLDEPSNTLVSEFKNKAKYGEDISIYVDYSIPSSQPRFFVYDNRKDSLISKSKCAHGCGGGSTADKPIFSNTPGSECSSLGTYRVRCIDKLNTATLPCIRIDGLSKTNSNAAARGIVIHEGPILADDISIGVIIPISKYISQGCFTISSKTFNLLRDEMHKNKNIYLYAYQSEQPM
ncbi:MAG: murein L,D-transpeptidase catalytic domain family protein [Muribaculaceae bacterium]|nr:murein L,D-transpeptidase catalytic domain family protein [Muribaculaceae bacterium]